MAAILAFQLCLKRHRQNADGAFDVDLVTAVAQTAIVRVDAERCDRIGHLRGNDQPLTTGRNIERTRPFSAAGNRLNKHEPPSRRVEQEQRNRIMPTVRRIKESPVRVHKNFRR